MRTSQSWMGCVFVVAATLGVFGAEPLAAAPKPARFESFERHFPNCVGLVSLRDWSQLSKVSAEDPAVRFERRRRAKKSAMRIPPDVVCRSQAHHFLRLPESAFAEGPGPGGPGALTGFDGAVGGNEVLDGGVEGYQGETHLTVDPNNPLRLVAGANTSYKDSNPACQAPAPNASKTLGTIALYFSEDAGASWTYRCAPWPSSLTGGIAGATKFIGSDPSMAFDSFGNAYAAYMLISATENDSLASIVVARSTDSGQTWVPWGTAASWGSNDKVMMAIDTKVFTNRVYLIWSRDAGAGDLTRIAWSENGTSWHTDSFAPNQENDDQLGGHLAIGDDGKVYAMWNSVTSTNGGDRVWFSKSTDGGDAWSNPVNVYSVSMSSYPNTDLVPHPAAQNVRGINPFPTVAISNSSVFKNRLYVTYCDGHQIGSNPDGTWKIDNDIFTRYSSDGGASWSNPVKVNDDLNDKTQMLPWMAVDQSDGTVNVAWLDARSSNPNKLVKVYYARSTDGGVSFEPNIGLSKASSDFANAGTITTNENSIDNVVADKNQYGDYIGVAAANRQVWVAWPDSRQFFPSSTSNPKKEDIASVRLVNCSPPTFTATPTATVQFPTWPVQVSWSPATAWGTNATSGAYTIYRYTGAGCTGRPAYVANVAAGTTSKNDYPPTGGVYSYRVSAINNCPGTVLTPMRVLSECSNAATYTQIQF